MRNLKRTLSLALAAVMLMGMMVVGAGAASSDFTDADEIKNVEAVDVMVALGILEGGDKGDFQPNSILTREQAAKIICYMVTWSFRTFVERHGLPPITVHGLRHTFASLANSARIPLVDIGKALGHKDVSITGRIYTHIFDQTHQEVLNTVAARIAAG